MGYQPLTQPRNCCWTTPNYPLKLCHCFNNIFESFFTATCTLHGQLLLFRARVILCHDWSEDVGVSLHWRFEHLEALMWGRLLFRVQLRVCASQVEREAYSWTAGWVAVGSEVTSNPRAKQMYRRIWAEGLDKPEERKSVHTRLRERERETQRERERERQRERERDDWRHTAAFQESFGDAQRNSSPDITCTRRDHTYITDRNGNVVQKWNRKNKCRTPGVCLNGVGWGQGDIFSLDPPQANPESRSLETVDPSKKRGRGDERMRTKQQRMHRHNQIKRNHSYRLQEKTAQTMHLLPGS